MPHKIIAHFFILLAAVVPITLKAGSDCTQVVAKVASAQGIVMMRAYEADEWQRIHTDDQICSGATVRTLLRSRATLIESSLAVITLDQHSTLTFTAPPAPDKVSSWFIDLLEGRVFFRSRKPQHLDIHTPFINAVHKGTEFMVAVDTKQAEITVFDGQVAGENSAGKITINQGFKGIAEAHRAPQVQALKISPEDAVQWALYYPPIVDDVSGATDSVLNSALTAYRQGDNDQALTKLDSIPVAQQNTRYFTLKAALLLTVGRVDEAQPLIQQAQQLEPNNADAFALQAIIAVAKNQQQTALELASKAVAAKPNSPIAKIAQSYAYQALFNIDEALKATQEAIRLAPDNALAWARLSELQLSQGDHDAALKSAHLAQTLNPKIARTQTILGFANLAQTEIEDAKQVFKQALALDSSDPLARLGLGLAKIRQGDVEEGKGELETAVNLDPNNAVIRSYLGKAYYELRNKDYAGTEYKIAKDMDPKDPTPWFYDAILKQTTNRPVEALHDMQKAIELNDNRGVYRSQLLLDKDAAARQVGLGRIFNNLGFDAPSSRQAMQSLATDPANYSAHRLISDSYLNNSRFQIARTSENLQSQLLQPTNYNPIQPSLAYSDLNIIRRVGPTDTAFNEYNRLFERNGVKLAATGVYGSNNTAGDEAAIAGIYNKLSYSLGQMHYYTDGFRKNNDLQHDIYNVFAQYEISPELNVQAEYNHRETKHGDLEYFGDPQYFDYVMRRNINQDRYRLGFKISPATHSDILTSFIYTDRNDGGVEYWGHNQLNTKAYNVESQYVFHNDYLNTVAGGGILRTNNSYFIAGLNNDTSCFGCGLSQFHNNQYFGYLYNNFKVSKNLTLTAGLSYDYGNQDNDTGFRLSELNPKLGFIWQANRYLTFRAAGFKTVKYGMIDNQTLQPTQIAGFNQFYDDQNSAVAWQYGVGADSRIGNILSGVEAYKRDLKIQTSPLYNQHYNEEFYRFYFNWAPVSFFAVNTEFKFENFRYHQPKDVSYAQFPNLLETITVPLELRFFEPHGFFASLKGTYVNQKLRNNPNFYTDENGNLQNYLPFGGNIRSEFYLVDAALGYRFPKQYGLISFEVKNLFDTNFYYRDRRFLNSEQRTPDYVPERMLFGRVTLNF
ncbi:MAG: tetratricopeptide repeat protein [Methyloglobulus sp.]|nr:tetratricopeptide repeat protein [Methyloglobulus sp.]